MSNEEAFMSAAEQGRLMRRRKLSPVELLEACLARIERYKGRLCAYITIRVSALLSAMEEIEADLGEEMNWVDPVPPVFLREDF